MSGISYILIIDELHRSICAEMGAYVCPFGPLLRSGPLQSLLAGKVQKIRIVFPATLPTRPDCFYVWWEQTLHQFFFCCPPFVSAGAKELSGLGGKFTNQIFMNKVMERIAQLWVVDFQFTVLPTHYLIGSYTPFLVLKDCVFACLHIHTSWNKYGNANGDMTRCAALSLRKIEWAYYME